MKFQLAASSLLLLQGAAGQAAFTDFSDYTQSQTFQPGEAFQSNTLAFRAVQLRSLPNPVEIVADSTAAALHPGPGVELLLPSGVQEISLYYVDGAGSAFAINGAEPTYRGGGIFNDTWAGFSYFDAGAVGGVEVSTTVLTQSGGMQGAKFVVTHETGILTLRGPISSLAIAGIELSLDDVTVLVPEPSAAVLFGVGAAMVLAARRPALPRRRLSRGSSRSCVFTTCGRGL